MKTAFVFCLALALAACSRSGDDATMSGYAEAEFVYVAASAGGTLQTLAVQRGAQVRRGQPLFTLDSDSEVISRDAAQARSERATSMTDDLRKGRRPLEIKAIDEQLAQARAALEISSATLARNQRLVAEGFIAPLRLDELVAARDRDSARVQELQAQRSFATEASRSDAIAAAAAEARGAQADLALARWREGQKQRQAPADALVYDVMYRVGEWVPAGAPVLALLPPGALKVRFFVPETRLAQAAVGAEVTLACDGCAAGLTARIRYISPQAEFTPPVIYSNGSRSKLVFMVEAEPSEPKVLKPGQPLDVRFKAAP